MKIEVDGEVRIIMRNDSPVFYGNIVAVLGLKEEWALAPKGEGFPWYYFPKTETTRVWFDNEDWDAWDAEYAIALAEGWV